MGGQNLYISFILILSLSLSSYIPILPFKSPGVKKEEEEKYKGGTGWGELAKSQTRGREGGSYWKKCSDI